MRLYSYWRSPSDDSNIPLEDDGHNNSDADDDLFPPAPENQCALAWPPPPPGDAPIALEDSDSDDDPLGIKDYISCQNTPQSTPQWGNIDLPSTLRPSRTHELPGSLPLRQDLEDWQLEKHGDKNILFYKDKNYIPDDLDLRQDIVKLFHDHEMAGHLGELETYNSVKQHYWWPGMCTFVKRYVQGCGICQQFKINRNPSHPSYLPIEGAKSTQPFSSCSMDMITDLPTSGGYNSILAVVDHGLMKGVILIPCNKTLTADQCAQLLLDNVYK